MFIISGTVGAMDPGYVGYTHECKCATMDSAVVELMARGVAHHRVLGVLKEARTYNMCNVYLFVLGSGYITLQYSTKKFVPQEILIDGRVHTRAQARAALVRLAGLREVNAALDAAESAGRRTAFWCGRAVVVEGRTVTRVKSGKCVYETGAYRDADPHWKVKKQVIRPMKADRLAYK